MADLVPVSRELFKSTLGRWASGVTIVTARHRDHVHGMTVSAFCSVSLDPPLVLVCADRSSDTHTVIRDGGVFAVSLLAEGQEELSNRFASEKDEHRRFEGLECRSGATGCPHIPGAVGVLDCRVVEAIDAGDHIVYVGEVMDADATDRAPLLYFGGAYRRLDG
jgi:flavin reductase (DIM6/NTAB) family NADH-FMN oxidoreductase RutF